MDPSNYVIATVHCPTCGERVENLQTKDASVEPLRYETVPLEAVQSFYGQCDRCNTWVEFARRPGTAGARPADYVLTWDPDRERVLSRRGFFTRFFDR